MKQTRRSTFADRILKAGAAVFAAHMIFKLIGFAQFYVVGVEVDTTTWETIYGFAFEGVIFSLFLVGEEMIGPAFLPLFIAEKEENSERAAWSLANTLLTAQFIVLIAIVVALMVVPGAITRFVTYWSDKPGHVDLAAGGVRLMAPALIFFSIGSTTYMLLNGYKRFFMAALGDAAWKACVLVGVVVGIGFMGMSWKALVLGVVAGGVAKVLTHVAGMPRMLTLVRPSFRFSRPMFRTLLVLMLPLFIGILFAKGRDFYNNITVLSSLEADGLIKANAYGRKLFAAISTVVPYALSIAMFPFFCDLAARRDHDKLAEILTKSGRMLLVAFIPVSLVFVIYSHSLVELLVAGKFSRSDAELAGVSMACYTLVLPAYSLEMLLMQAFFAKRKTTTITVVGIIFSSASILISYLGVIHFGAKGATALAIVALGFAASRTGKTIALAALIHREVPVFPARETASFLIRTIIVGLVCATAVWAIFLGFDHGFGAPTGKLALSLKLLAGAGAATAAFPLAAVSLKVREPFEMLDWTWRKLRRRGLDK